MQITVERRGGFTGLGQTTQVDTATLSAGQARQLRQLVKAADFFHLPATTSMPAQPDRFEYMVTVRENEQQHTVRFSEVAVPEPLKPLLSWVMKIARQ